MRSGEWCNQNTYMRLPRALRQLTVIAALLLLPSAALAWVESTFTADAVTIDVDRAGIATIRHELAVRVRGGPLRTLTLPGIAADAEPLSDGTLTRERPSQQVSAVEPLIVTRTEDGELRIEFSSEKGLRTGSYLLKVGYRTSLAGRGLVHKEGSWLHLSWLGPRYPSGLDAARVTFRLPAGNPTPRLPELLSESEADSTGILDSEGFLSSYRSAGTTDELILVRPRIARHEPVLWRLWASPSILELPSERGAGTDTRARPAAPPKALGNRLLPLLFGVLGFFVGALVLFRKQRVLEHTEQSCGVRFRPVLPWPLMVRAPLLGGALGTALFFIVRGERPTLVGALIALSLLTLSFRPPVAPRKLRGPGRWLCVRADEGLALPKLSSEGALLDAACLSGKFVLLTSLLVLLGIGVLVLSRDPYRGLLVLLLLALPFPLFFTGSRARLEPRRIAAARRFLTQVERLASQRLGAKVRVMARFPDGSECSDEVRLRLLSRATGLGRLSYEVGCTSDEQVKGFCFLRTLSESRAYQLLQPHLRFGQGRTPEERVAKLDLFTQSPSEVVGKLRELEEFLLAQGPAQSGVKSAARSRQSGTDTSKAGTTSLPANRSPEAWSACRPGGNLGVAGAP